MKLFISIYMTDFSASVKLVAPEMHKINPQANPIYPHTQMYIIMRVKIKDLENNIQVLPMRKFSKGITYISGKNCYLLKIDNTLQY